MYCAVDEFKDYRGIATDSDDTLLTSFIVRAQASIDAAIGKNFEAAEESTRYLDAVEDVDGRMLYLKAAGDLCSISTVTNGDGAVVTSSQYVTQPRHTTPYYAIKLLRSSGVVWRYRTDPEDAISITGRWAYSIAAPADIQHACIRLASWLYDQKDNASEMDRAVVAGNATILPARFPSDVMRYLKPYIGKL